MTTHERDFVGYGANPPDPKWPNGARLALNFVINYEEGSEASVPQGDGYSESGLIESPTSPVPRGERDLAAESMFEYGSRVGFWRLMRLFAERGLPLTVFGCALALERNPAAAQAIAEAGHDVCCHGWRWIEHYKLGETEEREHIRRAVASLQATVGERPLGWYCRYGPSVNTRRLLVEEGGFIYDSDTYNDELPYWVNVGGKPHLLVPYTLTNNDTRFARGFIANGGQFFHYLRDAFELLREEGAKQPKMMSVGLHMRLTGHPARASGLRRFLDHVAACDDVWLCRRVDIARHWHATHPYAGD
jgi:putative urate catabolism protein